jgi:peptidoglycan/LPS O-acetylase OafA/YrhL
MDRATFCHTVLRTQRICYQRRYRKRNQADEEVQLDRVRNPPNRPHLSTVSCSLLVDLNGRNFNTDVWAWLRAVAFLFTFTDAIAITPVWSLRLEVCLYVFAALTAMGLLATGRHRVVVLAFTMLLFAVYCRWVPFGALAGALFAAGALAAIFLDRLMKIRVAWTSALLVSALLLPIAWPALVDDSKISLVYQCLLGIVLALGLTALAHVKIGGQSWIARLALASGGWSYTLYIIHIPVVIAVTSIIPFGSGIGQRLAVLAICLIAANLVAFAVARVVERPKYFAKLVRRALKRQQMPADKAASNPVILENPRA